MSIFIELGSLGKFMYKNMIVLVENLSVEEALGRIKSLPSEVNKELKHKFVFSNNKEILISKTPDLKMENHTNVIVAGQIGFTITNDNKVVQVYMNNRSKMFGCAKFELLKEPQILITKIFGPICIDMEDVPKPQNKVIDLSTSATH